jgi:hypothetical protein
MSSKRFGEVCISRIIAGVADVGGRGGSGIDDGPTKGDGVSISTRGAAGIWAERKALKRSTIPMRVLLRFQIRNGGFAPPGELRTFREPRGARNALELEGREDRRRRLLRFSAP